MNTQNGSSDPEQWKWLRPSATPADGIGDDDGLTRFRFASPEPFFVDLRRRVSKHFADSRDTPWGSRAMYWKTAILLIWLVGSYLSLLFVPLYWWQAILLTLSLAIAAAGIGIAVQHDANHGAYAQSFETNRLLGLTLDLLGASSWLWRHRHNVVHHTYTNISGLDADLDFYPYLRLAPDQPRRWFHRAQHIYAWMLYAAMPSYWQYWADYRELFRGHIRGRRFPRPSGLELAGILLGKVAFYGWSLALPLALHPPLAVLCLHVTASLTLGLLLTSLFQLAHCVPSAEFLELAPGVSSKSITWAEHQVRSTVNFASDSRLLTWYIGGLNYQIEHHLFPKVGHRHYPRIARIVAATCAEYGIPYHSYPSLSAAMASHIRWLYVLGRT